MTKITAQINVQMVSKLDSNHVSQAANQANHLDG